MAAEPKPSAITPAARSSALAPAADHNPLAAALAAYAPERYNLCTPIVVLDSVPVMHRVSVRVVKIDPEAETYPVGKDARGVEKVGLGKTALDKIAAAAGISWIPERCGQIDQYRHPHRVKYRAVGMIRDFDGRSRVISGEREVDLRGEPDWAPEDLGSDAREFLRQAGGRAPFRMEIPQGAKLSACRDCGEPAYWAKTKTDKNILLNEDGTSHFDSCAAKQKLPGGWDRVYQQRANIHSLAETKAKLRAIRSAIGIPGAMTPERAALPFVVPTLVPDLDTSDPEIKRMVAASLLGSQAALYGPPSLPQGAQAPVLDEAEAVDVSAMQEADGDESEIVDAEPCQTTDLGPDPWDTAAAAPAKACRLPVPQATLDQVPVNDGLRMEYLSRLNALARGMFAELGAERAKAIIAHAAPDFDALTWTLPQIAELGKALRAELQGGGR
jgi:hypothetical protein